MSFGPFRLASVVSLTLIATVAAQAQTDRAAITAASAAERDRELKLLGIASRSAR